MEEKPISFETAKLAKEKGFIGINPTTDYVPMYIDGKLSEAQGEDDTRGDYCLAVTQGLLQKWLREKHVIQVYVIPTIDKSGKTGYINRVTVNFVITNEIDYKRYNTYEEALEYGLRLGLTLIK